MGTYLLIFVVLVVLLLLLLFFQPNQRVLKTVLENIPRRLQPSSKKKKIERKKKKEGTLVVVLLLWKVSKITASGMRLTELVTQWMLLCYFFFICGDICLFLGMPSGVGCRLSATLSGLHTSSSTPALCREAERLPFKASRKKNSFGE